MHQQKQKVFLLPQIKPSNLLLSVRAVKVLDALLIIWSIHKYNCSLINWEVEKELSNSLLRLNYCCVLYKKKKTEDWAKDCIVRPKSAPAGESVELKCTAHLPQHPQNETDPNATFQKSDTL